MSQELRPETNHDQPCSDFLERSALVSQTRRDEDEWGDVVVKELIDSALDACENVGVKPDIEVTLVNTDDAQLITVSDKAPTSRPARAEPVPMRTGQRMAEDLKISALALAAEITRGSVTHRVGRDVPFAGFPRFRTTRQCRTW